jgi:hypothetical protein
MGNKGPADVQALGIKGSGLNHRDKFRSGDQTADSSCIGFGTGGQTNTIFKQ